LDRYDWYRFETDRPGTAESLVSIEFSHAEGDLDLRLYNTNGYLEYSPEGFGDVEQVSLDHLPPGEYFVQVYGFEGMTNPSYSLSIDVGQVSPINADHTLWLNFDGANLTTQQLREWSTDWSISYWNLDDAHDGIKVEPFFENDPHRETIIGQIISHVHEDLSHYGITVQRWYDTAVEDRGETTIFIGDNDIDRHVAGDIDYGNDNRTDIAFVDQESWGNADDTALALAHVVLHEAGHTYGLHHVNTNIDGRAFPEAMGFRYSEHDQSHWVQDTSFMDRTFVEYLNHGGGRGSQNSHRTMLANFGLTEPVDPAELVQHTITDDGIFVLTTSSAADRILARSLDGDRTELIVNGQVFEIGNGIEAIQVDTQGDGRDVVLADEWLGIDLYVATIAGDRSMSLKSGHGTSAANEPQAAA